MIFTFIYIYISALSFGSYTLCRALCFLFEFVFCQLFFIVSFHNVYNLLSSNLRLHSPAQPPTHKQQTYVKSERSNNLYVYKRNVNNPLMHMQEYKSNGVGAIAQKGPSAAASSSMWKTRAHWPRGRGSALS